ncbi:C40 family peptidase [Micromonospora auratinigra]|uniref:Cell wall-associated hydrolase, NlpC family n=1 Tax=Micromonospora auratinigra TaxID=261654 RepID=A0A1A8ZRM8_9ACTN|nr:C40 family peptidase [Micromonospora auratinigra]SBT46483.1 Cell wall-associated hydrolase, NlpC family [Micromonospora auratinigra]
MSSLRILLRALAVAGLSAALVAPASVARAEPTPAELTKQIEKSSTELERIVESYNKLNEEIKTNKATSATLQARIGPLQELAERSRADVGLLAVTAYKTGGMRTARALLEPEGSASLPERLGALDQLSRQRQATISGFTDNQRKLIDQKTRLDTTLARQAAQAKQLAAGKKKIETDLAKLYQLRRQAYGRATEAPARSSSAGSAPAISGSAGVAVKYAYGAVGKPYVYGADGPSGYDCSGLTLAAWRAAGKSLPHNAAMQWDATTRISRSALKPGDLVFYSGLGHVALYVGSGQIIDAPSAGRNVSKRGMDIMPIAGYGRV